MSRQSIPAPVERARAEELLAWVREAEPDVVVGVIDEAIRDAISSPSWWASSAVALAEGIDKDLDRYAPPAGRWALADDVLVDVLLGLIVHLEHQAEPWADRVALRCRRWLGWRRRDVERCTEAAEALGVSPSWERGDILPRLLTLWVRFPNSNSSASLVSHRRHLAYMLDGPRRPWLWPWEPVSGAMGFMVPDRELAVVVPSDFAASELDRFNVAHLATDGRPYVHRAMASDLDPQRRRYLKPPSSSGSAPAPRETSPDEVDEVDETTLVVSRVEPEPVPVDDGPKPDGIVDGVPIRLDDIDSWGDSRPNDWGW